MSRDSYLREQDQHLAAIAAAVTQLEAEIAPTDVQTRALLLLIRTLLILGSRSAG